MRGVLITDFDPAAAYRLDPRVALRDEPFGALAYHYGSRRLSFLRSRDLVEVLRCLELHDSVGAAVDSVAPAAERARLLRALGALARSEMLVPA